MYSTVIRAHLPAFVIVICVMLVGIFAHPYLPDVIPTHFDKSGNPVILKI